MSATQDDSDTGDAPTVVTMDDRGRLTVPKDERDEGDTGQKFLLVEAGDGEYTFEKLDLSG